MPKIVSPRYCAGCSVLSPHVHCGACDKICTRDAKADHGGHDFCVIYRCSCGVVAVETPECDATERALADDSLRIADRYVHEHAR